MGRREDASRAKPIPRLFPGRRFRAVQAPFATCIWRLGRRATLDRKSPPATRRAICDIYEYAVVPYLSSRVREPLITTDQFKHFVAILNTANRRQAASELSTCSVENIGKFSTCRLLSLSELPIWQSNIRLDAFERLSQLRTTHPSRRRRGDYSEAEADSSDRTRARTRARTRRRRRRRRAGGGGSGRRRRRGASSARIEYAAGIVDDMPAQTTPKELLTLLRYTRTTCVKKRNFHATVPLAPAPASNASIFCVREPARAFATTLKCQRR